MLPPMGPPSANCGRRCVECPLRWAYGALAPLSLAPSDPSHILNVRAFAPLMLTPIAPPHPAEWALTAVDDEVGGGEERHAVVHLLVHEPEGDGLVSNLGESETGGG
jgi:hypothetical protein